MAQADPSLLPVYGYDFSEIGLGQMSAPISADTREQNRFRQFVKKYEIKDGEQIWLSDDWDRVKATVDLKGAVPVIKFHWADRQSIRVNGSGDI